MSEANWKKAKAALENPGYTIVRQSNQSGKVGGILKEGQDGYASNWIEINKADLGAAGGGGYDDTALWQETSDLQDQIDALDTAVQALPSTYATKKELTDAVADLQAQIDAIDGGSGGDPFDPSELEAQIAQLQKDVTKLTSDLAIEVQNRIDGDDALAAAIDENTAAIEANATDIATNTEAIENIKSTGYDDTQIRKDFAAADQGLQDQIDDLEGFDSTELEAKDAEQDGRLDAIETEQEEQNARLDDIDVEQKEQNDRLDALESDDDCGNILGHYINSWNYQQDGGAEARDYNIKLHKPSSAKGGEGGDLDDRDVWETTGSLQQGDIVYFKVGDEVHEREYSRRSEFQYYYDLVFTEQVDFIPKDTEFFMLDAPECADLAELQAQVDQNTADIQTNTEAIDDKVGIATGQDSLTMWRGTEAEYNLVADKDDNTLYVITG